ncbi:hypothetical protein [Mesomycoplasma hyorhinis]|uniref:hypothetical protein n=1 Tax=Mesomycoplasma hyorhinis TaxID=2100 RepID=UPI0002F80FFF
MEKHKKNKAKPWFAVAIGCILLTPVAIATVLTLPKSTVSVVEKEIVKTEYKNLSSQFEPSLMELLNSKQNDDKFKFSTQEAVKKETENEILTLFSQSGLSLELKAIEDNNKITKEEKTQQINKLLEEFLNDYVNTKASTQKAAVYLDDAKLPEELKDFKNSIKTQYEEMLNQQAKKDKKEFNSALTQDPMSKIKEHIEANKKHKNQTP